MTKRRILTGGVAALVAATIMWGTPARSVARAPVQCGISWNDLSSIDTCFTPAQVTRAEQRMPISPIHPTGVVWRFTRLRLTHVQLSRSGGTVGIDYLFGRLPTTASGIPDIAGPRPRYVLVAEGGGRGPFGRGKLVRTVNPAGPAQAKDEVYWEFYANFRCHNLALIITSNQPGSVVRKVGKGIANREVCGK